MSVLQILVSHELDGAVNNSEQSRDEPFVKSDTALVLDDLQEGVQHARVVALTVHLGRGQFLLQAQPGLDDSDGVGEDQRQKPGGGGRHQVFPCGQLLVGVSVLEPRLDCLGEDRLVQGTRTNHKPDRRGSRSPRRSRQSERWASPLYRGPAAPPTSRWRSWRS